MRTVILLAVVILLIAASSKAEVYQNEEFGIEVLIPKGVLLCSQPYGHDHGPVFLIGTSDSSCWRINREQTRYISIFGSYNVAEVTKNPHESLKWYCTQFAKGPCGTAPDGLEINGLPSAATRVDRSNGWIDILFSAQAGVPDPDFDPTVPSFNYDFTLHTKAKYLKEDLHIFRIILETVKLSPREMSQGSGPE